MNRKRVLTRARALNGALTYIHCLHCYKILFQKNPCKKTTENRNIMFNPTVLLLEDTSNLQSEISRVIESYFELVRLSYEHEILLSKESLNCSIIVISQIKKGSHGIYKLIQIRQDYPTVPVLIVYENTSHQSIITAFRYGATDVLTWPSNPDDLIYRLNSIADVLEGELYKDDQVPNWMLKVTRFFRKLKYRIFREFHTTDRPFVHRKIHSFSLAAMEAKPENLSSAVPDLDASFFGNFSIRINGEHMTKRLGKKARSILSYLIYHHSRPVRKEVLLDLFWPYSTPDSARNCLNVTLYQIRKGIQEVDDSKEYILFQDDQYFFDPLLRIDSDVGNFRKLWLRGKNMEHAEGVDKVQDFYHKAIALYKGDFLYDMLFEEWTDPIRENLIETYLAILSKLSLHSVEKQRFTQTIQLCQKMLEKDDCLEEAHRLLMFSYEKLGMRDKAVKQYQKCRSILRKELEVNPSRKTKDMYDKIRQ